MSEKASPPPPPPPHLLSLSLPPPLPSPSTRVTFLHNTYNISTAAQRSSQEAAVAATAPSSGSGAAAIAPPTAAALPLAGLPASRSAEWTSAEHARFVAALEQFGAARATSAHAAWHAIAATVRSRPVAEVKAHAARYLALLQSGRREPRGSHWTAAQDAAFEQLLAASSVAPADGGYPWAELAALVPGKTPQDLERRYLELCDDISRIERGGWLGGGEQARPSRKRAGRDGEQGGPASKAARRHPDAAALPALLASPLASPGVSLSFPLLSPPRSSRAAPLLLPTATLLPWQSPPGSSALQDSAAPFYYS